jgi:hypothetical protein
MTRTDVGKLIETDHGEFEGLGEGLPEGVAGVRSRRDRTRRRGRVMKRAGIAMALLMALAAGCGPDPLQSAVQQVRSAEETASLAISAHQNGKLTTPAAAVAVDDAISDASAALQTIGEQDRSGSVTRWAAREVAHLQRLAEAFR